jgi:hypothetical protein
MKWLNCQTFCLTNFKSFCKSCIKIWLSTFKPVAQVVFKQFIFEGGRFGFNKLCYPFLQLLQSNGKRTILLTNNSNSSSRSNSYKQLIKFNEIIDICYTSFGSIVIHNNFLPLQLMFVHVDVINLLLIYNLVSWLVIILLCSFPFSWLHIFLHCLLTLETITQKL